PAVLVPLVKYVVHDVHARRQIGWKWVRHSKAAESVRCRVAVGAQEPAGVGNDDPQHTAGVERTAAVPEKRRKLFAGLEMLDKVLDPDASSRSVTERQRPPAIPPDDGRRSGIEIEIDESLQHMRA